MSGPVVTALTQPMSALPTPDQVSATGLTNADAIAAWTQCYNDATAGNGQAAGNDMYNVLLGQATQDNPGNTANIASAMQTMMGNMSGAYQGASGSENSVAWNTLTGLVNNYSSGNGAGGSTGGGGTNTTNQPVSPATTTPSDSANQSTPPTHRWQHSPASGG
jgi:hypothetical protein